MSSWPSAKARRVLAARKRIGWRHDRTVGSHKIMKKDGWADYPFSFHDSEELGPAILVKVLKRDRPSTQRFVMAPAHAIRPRVETAVFPLVRAERRLTPENMVGYGRGIV